MNKLLVTGASGFLGWNLCQFAQPKWNVHGTCFTHEIDIPGVTLHKCNFKDSISVAELFQAVKPDAVIHAAAASKPNYCQANPEDSYAINVTAAVDVARQCAERDIPMAFTSTDLVFDGTASPYKEDDSICPINVYGEQKAIAEQEIGKIHPAAICRMPLMIGRPSPVSVSFVQTVASVLSEGKEMSLFTDEYRSPASARAASQGLLLTIEKTISGLLHLGGKERVSRYDFGVLVADILKLPTELVTRGKQADAQMLAPRAPDVSMDSSKAYSLGYEPWTLREELVQILSK